MWNLDFIVDRNGFVSLNFLCFEWEQRIKGFAKFLEWKWLVRVLFWFPSKHYNTLRWVILHFLSSKSTAEGLACVELSLVQLRLKQILKFSQTSSFCIKQCVYLLFLPAVVLTIWHRFFSDQEHLTLQGALGNIDQWPMPCKLLFFVLFPCLFVKVSLFLNERWRPHLVPPSPTRSTF